MLPHILLVAAAVSTAQQPAPAIGQRTTSPEQLLSSFGLSPDAAEDPAIAAAAAFPLGSVQNPVRVGGPAGERAYLARLRCANGSPPTIGGRTGGGVGAFGSLVNAYSLDCGSAAPGRTSVTIDIYHDEHRENRAPPGLIVTPAP